MNAPTPCLTPLSEVDTKTVNDLAASLLPLTPSQTNAVRTLLKGGTR